MQEGNILRRKHERLDEYTRSRNPKIHLGWQHFKTNDFKQVFQHNGGGVRTLPIQTLDIDIDGVVKLGTGVFYRNGKSIFGFLDDMETFLGDSAGNRLTFETIKGKTPNLGNYLRENGFQLSKSTFYLMTKKKEKTSVKSEADESLVSVPIQTDSTTIHMSDNTTHIQPDILERNQSSCSVSMKTEGSIQQPGTNVPLTIQSDSHTSEHPVDSVLLPVDESGIVRTRQDIVIKYYAERTSKYSDETSMIHCYSISQCKGITSFDEPVSISEVYNPCENGFLIGSIKIGGKTFLETEFEKLDSLLRKTVRFPSSTDNIDGIIIHEPFEIWGYDEQNLVVGILIGTTEDVTYRWYKNDTLTSSGLMNMIVVTEPGVYSCEVSFADIKQMSKPLQIISVRDIAKTASTCSSISAVSTSFVDCSSLTSSVVTTVKEISVRPGESFSREDKSIAKNNPSFAVPEVFVKDLNIDYSSVLGSGTFGTVYKGNWAGSEVAIKAISINKRSQKAMLHIVDKEIEISSKLRHPNIIQFLAVARGKTTIHLVHEYINGCNMEDAIFCEEKKLEMAITKEDKLFIMRQVVQAVAYMHALVPIVLHNDIKPGNVMIKKGCLSTKLCDMGISRIKSAGAATTTAIGITCGSPSYIAPECLLWQAKSSTATDMWSLGITLLEFFSEKDAWNVDNELDAISIIMEKMRKKVSPLQDEDESNISKEVLVLLKACVNYDNNVRCTAAEILRSL